MKISTVLALVIGVTASGSAFAMDGISDRERQALNNTQHEMTTCAAYYEIVRRCAINRGRPNENTDAKVIQNADAATKRLLKDAGELGSSLGMTEDAMYSRTPVREFQRHVRIHPNVSELLPTTLESLKPLG